MLAALLLGLRQLTLGVQHVDKAGDVRRHLGWCVVVQIMPAAWWRDVVQIGDNGAARGELLGGLLQPFEQGRFIASKP